MIRVLLVAPLDPAVPGNLKFLMGGENTYTRNLMHYPPKGVEYIHYEDALRLGQIKYLPIDKVLRILVKLRILPLSPGSKCFKLEGKFDLVHCHIYSLKLNVADVPTVLSDSSSNYLFLKYYINWPVWRIRLGYRLKKWLFDRLGIIDPDVRLGATKKLIVFSKFAFEIHKQLGTDSKKMVIVPPGLPKSAIRSEKKNSRINILFVGIWFRRKGGPDVVRAFKLLAKKYKNISLTIIGPVPKDIAIAHPRINQKDYVPRGKLLREYFPVADIFVIVPKVEGFGFALLEAMSFGIPSIVSNVCALPEIVSDGKTGFVIEPGKLNQLVARLERLITDRKLRLKMGEAAKKRFEEKFSIEKSNQALLKIYRQALS